MNNYAAILLSRQPLRPSAKTPWVQKVKEAVQWIKDNRMQLITSTGMQTWELQIAAALKINIKMKIVIPSLNSETFNKKKSSIIADFGIQKSNTELVYLKIPEDCRDNKKGHMTFRDRFIISEARVLVPISIRNKGSMERLLNQSLNSGKKSINHFRIEYQKRTIPIHYRLEEEKLSGAIRNFDKEYIIHWTRASNTKWPYERKIDYYNEVLKSPRYPREAFNSLCSILRIKKICASAKHIQDKLSTVSFTGLSPIDIIPLIRWRSRYRMMSFEPYGIAIEKEYALQNGIRPVIYYSRETMPEVKKEDHYLLQSKGEITDWRQEREFRYKGDFDLAKIPRDKMTCFCYLTQQAYEVEKEFKIKAFSFMNSK